jgi:hypothetical protein
METIPPEALLDPFQPAMRSVANELRDLVRASVPGVLERVRIGWGLIGYDVPVGRRTPYFAWILPQREHVHLGFVHGSAMVDPSGALDGSPGIRARWLTFLPGEPVDPTVVDGLLREAVRVAGMSRAERLLRTLDGGAGSAAP